MAKVDVKYFNKLLTTDAGIATRPKLTTPYITLSIGHNNQIKIYERGGCKISNVGTYSNKLLEILLD